MRYAFIHEQRACDDNAWPVWALCDALKISRNGFYDYECFYFMLKPYSLFDYLAPCLSALNNARQTATDHSLL